MMNKKIWDTRKHSFTSIPFHYEHHLSQL